jgi:FkbM family methyltransferase
MKAAKLPHRSTRTHEFYPLGKFRKLIRCISTSSYRRALLEHRVAAAIEHEAVLMPLACQTIIDVGANRGQFALVARRCFPKARVISFEPLHGPASRFRAVFANEEGTVLNIAAIGPSRGEAIIHISRRDDSSSLLPITPTQTRMFPGTGEQSTTMVQVGRLQDFVGSDEILAPALLKLDVQGFELQALEGCESLLGRFAYVYAECSFIELYQGQALAGEVIAWLAERGFRSQGTYNTVADKRGKPVQADFLFKSVNVR